MIKIYKVSRCIQILLVVIAFRQVIAHGLLVIKGEYKQGYYQLSADSGFTSIIARHQVSNSWENITQALEVEGFNSLFILGTVELIPYLLIYFFLFKLFSHYYRGEIFTDMANQCLKNIGKTLIFWIGINIIYPVLVTLFIRFGGWSDSLAVYIGVGSTELYYLLLGLVIYVVAWVMTQGLKLQKEQELTI